MDLIWQFYRDNNAKQLALYNQGLTVKTKRIQISLYIRKSCNQFILYLCSIQATGHGWLIKCWPMVIGAAFYALRGGLMYDMVTFLLQCQSCPSVFPNEGEIINAETEHILKINFVSIYTAFFHYQFTSIVVFM